MAQFQHDDLDYMIADYEMADFDDNVEDDLHTRRRGDVDADIDDEFDGVSAFSYCVVSMSAK